MNYDRADLRYAIHLGAPAGTWANFRKAVAKLGRYEEALEALHKENDTAHAYNTLGEVARDGGDLQRAQGYFADALRAAPRYFQEARENLAEDDVQLAAAAPLGAPGVPGAPAARITPAGANTAAIGWADPERAGGGVAVTGESAPASAANQRRRDVVTPGRDHMRPASGSLTCPGGHKPGSWRSQDLVATISRPLA